MRRSSLNVPLAGIFLLALSSCSSLAPPVSGVDKLKPCANDEGPSDAYCGKQDVWEDRTAKTGRKISLNILVLPGLKHKLAPDPLFFLAGGPGQGAAKLAKDVKEFFHPIQMERDIVFVDQRGTGASNPLKCKDEDEKTVEMTPDIALERMRHCLASLEGKADLRLYTTTIAMDDLDDVRQYLGYDKINLYGGSYGTRAAIVYTRQHRDHVRSVVIDSVAPTNMGLPLYMARDGQRAVSLMFRDCEKDAECNKRFPDLAGRFERLLAGLDAHPKKVKVTNPRTGEEREIEVKRSTITATIFSALYNTKTASLLPLLLERAEKGDIQGFLALQGTGSGIESNMAMGMHFSVVCSEDAPLIHDGDLGKQATGTFIGPDLAEWRMKVCGFWPHGQVEKSYYDNPPSDVPALVLSGELDPVTPPQWGQQVVSAWTNARHIIVPGTGHGALFSGCSLKLMTQFLNDGSAAKLNPECVGQVRRSPFFLGAYGPDPMGVAK